MYVCIYVCMYLYVSVCICMYLYVSVCICMYLYVSVCICMYVCMYVYIIYIWVYPPDQHSTFQELAVVVLKVLRDWLLIPPGFAFGIPWVSPLCPHHNPRRETLSENPCYHPTLH